MNNSTKELCYKTKLAVIKAITEMNDEDILNYIKEAIERCNRKEARESHEMQNLRKKNETFS